MPSASHHLVCTTDDEDGVLGFLRDVVGVEEAYHLDGDPAASIGILGWPHGSPGATGSVLGRGTAGLIELLRIPDELRGVVPAGVLLIAFAVDDLEGKVAACRDRGLDVTDIFHEQTESVDASIAVVRIGGLAFEMVRFGVPTRRFE